MKKNIKRVASLGLALLMALGMVSLTGCKDETTDDSVVVTWLAPADKQEDLPKVMEKANEIISKELPGVTLDLQFIDVSAYNQRMNMNMASQADFDICFTSSWLNNYPLATQRGGLLNLDEYLKDMPELKKAIPDYAWESVKIGGSIYSVPNIQIMAACYSTYVRKDLAEKYNLDVNSIKHVEDLEGFLEKVKNGEPNVYPYRANYTISMWSPAMDSFNNVASIDANSKVSCSIESDTYKRAINKLRDWYLKGYIRQDNLSKGDDTSDFNNGKYAVWDGVYKPGAEAEFAEQIGYEVISIPPYVKPKITTKNATSTMLGISKQSKHPKEALQIIHLMHTNEELFRLIAFGIEGEHYTLDEEGFASYIDGSGYTPKDSWKFGNTFLGYPLKGQSKDVFEVTHNFNESAETSKYLGFTFEPQNVESEIAQINSINGEYSMIASGAVDPNKYLDEYIKKHREAGCQKVVKETQRQLDEFLKTK